jgi:hypothetical protein
MIMTNMNQLESYSILQKYIKKDVVPLITEYSGTMNIGCKVYSDGSMDPEHLLGKIESMQINNNNIIEATIDQEICIKITSKKNIGDYSVLFVKHKKLKY